MWLYFRYSKKFKIVIITLSIMVLVCFVFIIKNAVLNENKNNNSEKNKYVNKEVYFDRNRPMNFRNVEYVGGEKIYINRPIGISDKESTYVGDRWYSFYRDNDTGEILRGLEYYNYITAGMPYVGIDKMLIPEERKTIKGFQEYVLNWTGSVSCQFKNYIRNAEIRRNIKGDFYGNGIYDVFSYGYFDRPIDLVADYLWGNDSNETTDGYDIYNIEDVKNYKYGLQAIELSSNEWVMNILRNCFGYISDDFYDLYNKNIINFEETNIENIRIGDIGVYGDEEYGYHMGICVGVDKKNNPIFSVCTIDTYLEGVKEYINIKKSFEVSGFNILHIEDKNNKKLFKKYYKTYLPFKDDNVNNKSIIIEDVSIFNEQIKIENKNKMYNRLINERIRRINEREKKAEELREIEQINLEQYKDIDISTLYLINEINSYEYQHLFRNISEDRKNEFHRTTYEEWKQEKREKLYDYHQDVDKKTFELIYESSLSSMEEFVSENRNLFKNKSEKDIEKWFYNDFGGIAKIDLDILLRFLKEHPEVLD